MKITELRRERATPTLAARLQAAWLCLLGTPTLFNVRLTAWDMRIAGEPRDVIGVVASTVDVRNDLYFDYDSKISGSGAVRAQKIREE